jgi:hypothetical protein
MCSSFAPKSHRKMEVERHVLNGPNAHTNVMVLLGFYRCLFRNIDTVLWCKGQQRTLQHITEWAHQELSDILVSYTTDTLDRRSCDIMPGETRTSRQQQGYH